MQLKLIVVGGARSGEEVAVTVPKFIIGRDRDCHLRCNSDVVSRHHCALIVESNYISVIDFSSKNGTFVDGERVVRERELQTGSLLAVGPLKFLVQLVGVPLGEPVADRREDGKMQVGSSVRSTPLPEEIVDDWSDALDPAQLQSSLEDSNRIDQVDPHFGLSKASPPKHEAYHRGAAREQTDGASAAQNGGNDSEVEQAKESVIAKDTRTAAMDALRKIGKRPPKKT
ncbi:MAG: FHA domain-containing protein [Planctomycetota bacterium]|nr:FHA domain-containing protein [Planctomycetota bacterium]